MEDSSPPRHQHDLHAQRHVAGERIVRRTDPSGAGRDGGQPAFIKIDDGTPTAAATDPLMPANWVDYFTVNPGQKIAVLQAGTAGTLSVTEMN